MVAVYYRSNQNLGSQMMDELLLYSRLTLHMITFAFLVSYRTRETSRPWLSVVAAGLAGVSLAAAAHVVLMRPESHQLVALMVTAAACVVVVRCRGNLARVGGWKAMR